MRYSSDVDCRCGPCGRRWSARSRRSRRRGRRSARHDGLDVRSAQRADPLRQVRETFRTERVVTTWQNPRGACPLVTQAAYACIRIVGHDADLTAVIIRSRIGRRSIPIRRGSGRRSRRRVAQSRRRSRSFMSTRRSAQSAEHLGAPRSPDARWSDCRPGGVRGCIAHRRASSIATQIKASVGVGASRSLAVQRTLSFESCCLCSCQSCLPF